MSMDGCFAVVAVSTYRRTRMWLLDTCACIFRQLSASIGIFKSGPKLIKGAPYASELLSAPPAELAASATP